LRESSDEARQDARVTLKEEMAIEILTSLKEAMGFGGYKGEHWGMMTQHERDIYLGMVDTVFVPLRKAVEGIENENANEDLEVTMPVSRLYDAVEEFREAVLALVEEE